MLLLKTEKFQRVITKTNLKNIQWDSVELEINLKLGNDAFKCYTCDFTHDYIDINADYIN